MTKKKSSRKKGKGSRKVKAEKQRPTAGRSRLWLPVLVIAALAFVLYANTLGHQYALDDASAITENYVVKEGLSGTPTILRTSYRYGYWNSNGTLYRPLSLLTFAVEWELAPESPGLSHFVNVLLYALTGILLFFTLRLVFRPYHLLLPFLAAVFFIAHPVHTEVVANIKSRDELLAFFFCLGAVYALWKYLNADQWKYLLLAVGSYTLAMFSKENAVTFLAVIPLLLFCFRKMDTAKILTTSVWFLLPVAVYFLTRHLILGGVLEGSNEASPLDNLLMATSEFGLQKATAFVLLGKYLVSLLFPVALVSDYGYNQLPLVGWGDWRALLSLAVWLGLTIWAIINIRRRPIPAFAVLYTIITFSVYANLVITIGSSYGERFLYMASLGLAIALAWALLRLSGVGVRPETGRLLNLFTKNKILLGATLVIVLLYAVKTIDRNRAWYDSYALYHTDIATSPNSAKLNYHYGLEQVKNGLDLTDVNRKNEWIQKGMDSFQKAIALYPQYHDAYGELGLGYFRLGLPQKALESYQKSLEYKPNNAKAYSNMGIIYFQNNQLDKAQEVYEKAVSLDPRFVDARRNLGSVFAQQKRFDEAIEQFSTALQYDPNNATLHQYIGFVYRDKGEADKARQWLDKAKQLDPNLK